MSHDLSDLATKLYIVGVPGYDFNEAITAATPSLAKREYFNRHMDGMDMCGLKYIHLRVRVATKQNPVILRSCANCQRLERDKDPEGDGDCINQGGYGPNGTCDRYKGAGVRAIL
jgi:hypothetical protein